MARRSAANVIESVTDGEEGFAAKGVKAIDP
jgi:hypothetical protein